MKKFLIYTTITTLLVSLFIPAHGTAAIQRIVSPIPGGGQYSNDFNAYRSLNGVHNATDIFAPKHSPIVSPVDGRITYVGNPQPSWGWYIVIEDDEGYEYGFIHINNDTPGTDNGNGGPMNAYAQDMKMGNRVFKGQLIGYVGDSGNAENTAPHLHFEIRDPNNMIVNPYDHLRNAAIYAAPVTYPQLVNEILPYGNDFKGNGTVDQGQFDSDTKSETVIGAGYGGGPHVKLLDDNKQYKSLGFLAYDENFRGGVNVAAGDIDGDGIDEIITGAGTTGGPHVKAFKADGTVITSFFAYNEDFRGGVDVASGNVNGDSKDEIITGAGPSGGPHIAIFDKSGKGTGGFFAYAGEFAGGVRVAVGNVQTSSPYDEIAVIPASKGGPEEKIFSTNGNLLKVGRVLEEWWEGSYDISASENGTVFSSGGNRRMTIRSGLSL